MEKFITKYYLLLIILFSIPAVWSLFSPGFFGVSDDLHIGWLYEMHEAIKVGQLPPRYVPDLSFGFGYPLFNFVFPLPFYIGEIFHLFGFSFVDSIKAVFIMGIPLSMFFMYKLLKEFTDNSLSFAGAVLYVFSPYRATEIFVRGAIGEATVFLFLPLVFLSLIKVTNELRLKNIMWVGIGAFSIASLVLSHNITAYMFTPFILTFLLIRIIFLSKDRKAAFVNSSLILLLGLLISIYFWGPAIWESRLMVYQTVFNFIDHFPTVSQLITPYFGYGASVPGPGDGISFFIGLVNLLVVSAGTVIFLIYRRKITKAKSTFILWGLTTFIISIFMMNHRSSLIWQSIPYLPLFQFPWRFLTMVTFVVPIFLIAFEKLKLGKAVALFIILSSVLTTFSYFKPESFLGRKDEYYISRYIPTPIASEEYKKTAEEYLRLPKETKVRPDTNYPRAYSGELVIKNILNLNSLDAKIDVEASFESNLNYNKYNFPGWVAKVDGQKTEIFSGQPFGQISLLVPAGKHTVEIMFRETKFRKILNAISLFSFTVSLLIIFKKRLS